MHNPFKCIKTASPEPMHLSGVDCSCFQPFCCWLIVIVVDGDIDVVVGN